MQDAFNNLIAPEQFRRMLDIECLYAWLWDVTNAKIGDKVLININKLSQMLGKDYKTIQVKLGKCEDRGYFNVTHEGRTTFYEFTTDPNDEDDPKHEYFTSGTGWTENVISYMNKTFTNVKGIVEVVNAYIEGIGEVKNA